MLPLLAFLRPAIANISCVREGSDHRAAWVVDDGERKLNVDRGAVLADRACRQRLSTVLGLSFRERPLIATPVGFAETLRDDEVQILADRFLWRVVKNSRGGRIPFPHDPLKVRNDP